MRRSLRNQLAELLLRAFEEPGRDDGIRWLRLFCELSGRGDQNELPLVDLLEGGRSAFGCRWGAGRSALAEMICPGGLFRVRRADTGEDLRSGLPSRPEGVPWVIGLGPDAHPDLAAVCERVRGYVCLLDSLLAAGFEMEASDPLGRAVAQAAACFDAGLFFEAHEHLEQFWRNQPRGETRRFLQGIIQISVGFHHARRGSYDGAVNQLTKGLEKTAGVTGEVLGLAWDPFLPAVAKIRDAIVSGGRGAMRSISPTEIPRMGVPAARCGPHDPDHSDDRTEKQPMTREAPLGGRE